MMMDADTIHETTIRALLLEADNKLQQHGIESPSLIAELLLQHILGIQRVALTRMSDRMIDAAEAARFNELLQRAMNHEPLQYIMGEAEFMGLSFKVDRRVLIPRPDTEILVEKVIELSKSGKMNLRILDIGTGSGNIAVALAKFLSQATIDAIDSSEDALLVAIENVHKHILEDRVNVLKHDINAGVAGLFPPYDVIVSNPPYISTDEYKILPKNVKDFEPVNALYDGGDGLEYYRRIAAICSLLLAKGGLVAVEIGYNQSHAVREIFQKEGYGDIILSPDYNRVERVLTARIQ